MNELAPVVDDLSIYLICGRVTTKSAAGYTHVKTALRDGVEAERLGFRRGWLSERLDLKESGAILAGVAARTSRFGVGTGAIAPTSRHVYATAAFGATMQALYDERFILGLGRFTRMPNRLDYSISDFLSFAKTVKSLWSGGKSKWLEPGHEPRTVVMTDTLGEVAPPEIWYCTVGNPKAAKACGDPVFDGVMLYPYLTDDAVRRAVERIRNACADNGRDPHSIRIAHPIVVAAELDDLSTRAYAHARAVTYLDWPMMGEALVDANGWDRSLLQTIRNHSHFRAGKPGGADLNFHRAELMDPAKLVPDELMEASCAIGTVAQCVERLAEYRATGVDEIAIYGSTPAENASLIAAWRDRDRAPSVPQHV